MESNGRLGRGGGRHPCTSWTGRTSYLQGTMLVLVMFMAHFQSVASLRNESLLWFDTPQPWNKDYYKIQRQCQDFRFDNDSGASFFYLWPEDDLHFDHCCSRLVQRDLGSDPNFTVPEGKLMADNFTYGDHGPRLNYVPYYDLGMIDWCFPYWKCHDLYDKFYRTINFCIPCECTDVQRLYSHRFWNESVLKYGLLQSALPFILLLEVLLVFFALPSALYCFRQKHLGSKTSWIEFLKDASVTWFEATHKTIPIVWIHLCLLAIIGNGLLEAVGHLNPYQSQSKSFYNYARLYAALSLLLWLSSFLQQLSYWLAVIDDIEVVMYPIAGQTNETLDIQSAPCARLQSLSMSRHSSVLENLEEKIGLNADWKWQPIAAQVAILFCLWGFLTYIDDENNSSSAGLFGIVVTAAAPWSGLYAVKIILDTLSFIARRSYSNLKAGNWLPVIGLLKSRGRRGPQHADPEDPDQPLAEQHLPRSVTP